MLAVSFAAACVALFSPEPLGTAAWWRAFALLAVLYTALLLRYRVTDEWKDFLHDSRVYPGRPVPSGAISYGALVAMGVTGVVVEIACVVLLGGSRGWWLYGIVAALSLLTAFEFFAKEWMNRHFTLEFVVHQLVYIPMFLWAAVVLAAPTEAAPVDGRVWVGVASATALFVSAELVRKFQPRKDTAGAAVPDTYSVVWGRPVALAVTVVLIAASGTLAHLVATGPLTMFVSFAAVVAILLNHRSDSWVMAGAGAHVPLLALAMLW